MQSEIGRHSSRGVELEDKVSVSRWARMACKQDEELGDFKRLPTLPSPSQAEEYSQDILELLLGFVHNSWVGQTEY